RVAAYQVGLTGRLGVVGQARLVVTPTPGQRREQCLVSGQSAVRWDLGLDRAAGELVPELQGVAVGSEQARCEQLVERLEGHPARVGDQLRVHPPRVQRG